MTKPQPGPPAPDTGQAGQGHGADSDGGAEPEVGGLLDESESRLKTILGSISVGIAIVGKDKRVRWVNRAALEMARIPSSGEVAGRACNKVLCEAPDDRCPVLDLGQTVDKVEKVMPCADGTRMPILKSVREVDFDGETMLLETFTDLTKHKQLETDLANARKLESVGQLAAGIAHEINTPTQYVGDSVHFLKDAFACQTRFMAKYRQLIDKLAGADHALLRDLASAEDEEDLAYLQSATPESFERCLEGIGRITTIVQAMKTFVHPGQHDKSAADLNHALESTLTIARNEYKYVADVETELGCIPLVICDIDDVNQVFLNLIVNAAHAIGDAVKAGGARGRIRVHTRQEGSFACVDITDTGTGIPEAIRGRVFDPFFTTKEIGKGTGQGLAISRSIVVDKHYGSLTFTSEPGKGSTFTVRLPIDGKRPATE